MLKKLAITASILALMSGTALAQTSTTNPRPTTGQPVTTAPASSGRWLASTVYKADIYDASDNKIGTINDLVMDGSGNITTAVVGVGGFLGMGQKDVAVPFGDLKISAREGKNWFVLDRTKDQLQAALPFDKQAALATSSKTGRSVATTPSSLSANPWLASEIYRADIYDQADNKIGVVDDLVMNDSGQITTAVIGVGGFLGMGEKNVAVPFSDLKVAAREGKERFILDRSKDQLKAAPSFDKKAAVTEKM